VAHVAAHELGAAAYAIKAVRAGAPPGAGESAGQLECRWQRLLDDQRLRNDICWSVFESSPEGAVYPGRVSHGVPGGVVHELPADLERALIANPTALDAWRDITPLARNEFICWVEDAKQEQTRERRIRRTGEELEEGQRRPCCWPGCKHRERNGR
jgi:hypothetical protein